MGSTPTTHPIEKALAYARAFSVKFVPDVKEDIDEAATDWFLLFQMASIQEDDYELMFGDLGNLYFYIRKQDLMERSFDKVWLVLQCG